MEFESSARVRTAQSRASNIRLYLVGTGVLSLMWVSACIPTIFFFGPEIEANTTYRANESSLWNQCRKSSIGNLTRIVTAGGELGDENLVALCFVTEHLKEKRLFQEKAALVLLLENSSFLFNYRFMERFAKDYNLSQDLWLRPCHSPLQSVPDSFHCTPPCLLPQLRRSSEDFIIHLGSLTLVISFICGIVAFATWLSLPFMSSFPHVIPLYIVAANVVVGFLLALPGLMSLETAFCRSSTSDTETVYCYVQGIVMQYTMLFIALWYLCYCLNMYLVIVHNKPHLILRNRRTYVIQFLVCFLLPLVRIATQFATSSQIKYFEWTTTDYFLCIPTDSDAVYLSLFLPSQLALGIGSTLLVLTAMFMVKSERDVRGARFIQNAGMESGITSVGKRLIATSLSTAVVAIFVPSTLSYAKTFANAKHLAVISFLQCKQWQQDCPEYYDQYSATPIMVCLYVVMTLYVVFVSLLLIGTPAKVKLWKYWLARLLLFFHVSDPEGKYLAWREDLDLRRYRRSQSERSFRQARVRERAEIARRGMEPVQHVELKPMTSGASNENFV